jgi:hypothetical protein
MSHPEASAAPAKKKRSGTERRQRQPRIIFRVSKEERAEIKAAADAAGLTVGSFLRGLALAAPRTRAVRHAPPDLTGVRQFLAQIGWYTGNLHQLVKRVNLGEFPRGADLAEITREAREFLDLARTAWKGL